MVPQTENLPNFSTAKGSNGEAQFLQDADRWWGAYTGAPSFCTSIKKEFHHRIQTDGFSASILTIPLSTQSATAAHKRKRQPTDQGWVRGMEAGVIMQAQQTGHLVGVDPGRRAIFTAAVHTDTAAAHLGDTHLDQTTKYRTFSWSAKRWHEESGSNERKQKAKTWLEEEPLLHQAMLNTPTPKVATVQLYTAHILHRLQHAEAVGDFYSKPKHRKLRRKAKIRRQKALQKACNDISLRSHKTVVAYGDAGFSCSSRGLAPTPTSSLRRKLGNTCRVCDVDEFRTSMLCCACHNTMTGMPLVPRVSDRGCKHPRPGELLALQ